MSRYLNQISRHSYIVYVKGMSANFSLCLNPLYVKLFYSVFIPAGISNLTYRLSAAMPPEFTEWLLCRYFCALGDTNLLSWKAATAAGNAALAVCSRFSHATGQIFIQSWIYCCHQKLALTVGAFLQRFSQV
jgi:hypothetical protein